MSSETEIYSDLSDEWETTQDALSGKLMVILSHDERFISNALKFSVNDMVNTMVVEIWATHNRYCYDLYKIMQNLRKFRLVAENLSSMSRPFFCWSPTYSVNKLIFSWRQTS